MFKWTSLFSLLIAITVLAAWELACRGFIISDFILPTPSRILTMAVFGAAILLPHTGITAAEVRGLVGVRFTSQVSES